MSRFGHDLVNEAWAVRKPAVESAGGVVASQHFRASQAGAQVLAAGGNAIDAAVATGLAVGCVEPWMSGLGGGGFMVIYLAAERRCRVVSFGMQAPFALDPADYPLSGGVGGDLFAWPAVQDDRNVLGPYSMAVPGQVAGMALALAQFGTRAWGEVLAPAIELARDGLTVDWFATLKIAAAAKQLARFPSSRAVYLPGGFAPAGEWAGRAPHITLTGLADTLEWLAKAGPDDFYRGDIACAISADATAVGAKLGRQDLAAYRAECGDPLAFDYRGARVFTAPGLTAGPSLARMLATLAEYPAPAGMPGAAAFEAYAGSLLETYRQRFAEMGDVDDRKAPGCTSHLTVVDRHGNVVALTQTLLSVFGSKLVLPTTGILMNNGVMWFDPRPGRPNSLAPGKRPLCNMCPTVARLADGRVVGLGASGGRRIVSAVSQLVSFLVDCGMSLDEAIHHPRIDVSGTERVSLDPRLAPGVIDALAARYLTRIVPSAVYPNLYACPNAALAEPAGRRRGVAFVMSPWAAAVAEDAI